MELFYAIASANYKNQRDRVGLIEIESKCRFVDGCMPKVEW
jgi:hypothetical protein